MSDLKTEFIKEIVGKDILVFFANGFQLRGKLHTSDAEYMLIETDQYNGLGKKTVLVSHANVSTYVPISQN